MSARDWLLFAIDCVGSVVHAGAIILVAVVAFDALLPAELPHDPPPVPSAVATADPWPDLSKLPDYPDGGTVIFGHDPEAAP